MEPHDDPTLPPRPAAPPPPATSPPRSAVDVYALRHHAEPERFVVAAVASAAVVGVVLLLVVLAAGVGGLIRIAFTVAIAIGAVWFVIQVARSQLLGNAARVTPQTFPVFSAAVEEVRRRLGYDGRVELFVVAKAARPVSVTSFLGTRVIVVEGDLVGELCAPAKRAQLEFVLATHFGALKARHHAWVPALVAMQALNVTRVLRPFIAPWERTTVLTGDQVAAIACGRLDEAVIALNRLLVGKDLAPSVGMSGIVGQAVLVRQDVISWLQQLYAYEPHLMNRYLNLLAFASARMPEQARAYRERLDATVGADVDRLLAREAGQYRAPARRSL